MFNLFHLNKLHYEKGQLMPFFIAALAILIIMSLITVNLSKLALIKTDSSNTADAGSLAAGSSMATTFNSVAVSNSYLWVGQQEFMFDISTQFTIAMTVLALALAATITAEGMATAAEGEATAAEGEASSAICGCQGAAAVSAAIAKLTAAYVSLTDAQISLGKAAKQMSRFIKIIKAIGVTITGQYIAQKNLFASIRRNAQRGRRSAVKLGYQYAFRNSGVSSKLKSGLGGLTDPDAIRDLIRAVLNLSSTQGYQVLSLAGLKDIDFDGIDYSQNYNYQNMFNLFLSSLKHNTAYVYPWEDGQGRNHYVAVSTTTGDVDNYRLKVTALPYPAEMALVALMRVLAGIAVKKIGAATASYEVAKEANTAASAMLDEVLICYQACCSFPPSATGCNGCCCCPGADMTKASAITIIGSSLAANGAGLTTNGYAITTIAAIIPEIPAAWAGLIPGRTMKNPASMDIICWIEDIIHNRKVYVSTLQDHQGDKQEDEEGGGIWVPEEKRSVWKTGYVPVLSYAVVDFAGRGRIDPTPRANFDASIIKTDLLQSSYSSADDVCPIIEQLVYTLRSIFQTITDAVTGMGQAGSDMLSNVSSVNWGGVLQDPSDFLQMLTTSGDLSGVIDTITDTLNFISQIATLTGQIDSLISGNTDCNF